MPPPSDPPRTGVCLASLTARANALNYEGQSCGQLGALLVDALLRLSPPAGTPRLTWQDAYRRYLHGGLFAHSDSTRMPLVELATLRPNPAEFPPDHVLVWVVVVPDAESVSFGGPDFSALGVKPAPARLGRCPAYTLFDANTGRALVAFQTCEPPFRG